MSKKVINENILRQLIRNILHEAVDELNLYHGTHADFDKFDVAYLSTGWGQQAHGYGFYLTDCYEAAKYYSCGGKVMEVKVPDGKYLSDKRISPREKQVIARTFFKYYTEELDYGKEAYPDAQARNDFWQYEVSCILNCDDGAYVYGAVASLLGSNEDASNFLHDKLGYVGITIHTKHGETGEPITTYVIFNPNDIEILNKDVVNENWKGAALGAALGAATLFGGGQAKAQNNPNVNQLDTIGYEVVNNDGTTNRYYKTDYAPDEWNFHNQYFKKQCNRKQYSEQELIKLCPSAYADRNKSPKVWNKNQNNYTFTTNDGRVNVAGKIAASRGQNPWQAIVASNNVQTRPITTSNDFDMNDFDINEGIDKYQSGDVANKNAHDIGLGQFGLFKLSPAIMSCIYEAAFQLLGYERFAIDGEMVMDNSVMDNPWDDAYHILKWAIDNKGLDKKYLGRVSSLYSDMDDNQFHNYIKQVENGKIFWFSKEELSEIFRVLPDALRKHLVQDMLNVGRTGKIRATVEQLKQMNGGENLERFIEIIRRELKSGNVKRGIANFKEPVRQAMQTTLMLGSGK